MNGNDVTMPGRVSSNHKTPVKVEMTWEALQKEVAKYNPTGNREFVTKLISLTAENDKRSLLSNPQKLVIDLHSLQM